MTPTRLGLPAAFLAASLSAQEPPVSTAEQPLVVTATRQGRDPFDLPYSASVLTADDLGGRQQARTTPEALRFTPGVSVQKTAHGQGSPKIRGQTGFQTLLLVDGVRINDSTWRTGNVEYWNHLDPLSFERFELVRGPGAVLWGSDAVSGTGHAILKGRTSWADGTHADVALLTRYATADDSFVHRVEHGGNIDQTLGWQLGFSYKDFGDLRAGRGVGTLAYTGYDEVDGDGKLTWRLGGDSSLTFGFSSGQLDDVPRTHSTVRNAPWRGLTAGSDLRREHDHRRQLYLLKWVDAGSFYDRMEATVSYKRRYEREDRTRGNGRRQFNVLEVDTVGVALQLENELGGGGLVYGLDWYRDSVDSTFRDFNPDGTPRSVRDRGVVAGDAEYDLAGVFAQYTLPLGSVLEAIAGARYTWAALDAERIDTDPATADGYDDDWNAVTGNLRLLARTSTSTRLFAGVSQGFRAPNLSDTTRLDAARTGEVEVPSTGLDPEEYTTFELGGRYDDGGYRLAATGWYTLVRDQIGRFRTGNVTSAGEFEVMKANVGDGWLAGFEVEAAASLRALSCEGLDLDDWSLYGFLDYVDGRIDQLDSAGNTIEDRPNAMPPVTGMLALRWQHPERDTGVEIFTRMARHVDPSRFTQSDADNTSRIPPDGLPGYAVIGLRGWHEVTEKITASLAVENLGDVDHRIMDSGQMEPGTNVVLTVRAAF